MWRSVKDICGDGGLFKKVIAEGEKWEKLKDFDEVYGECFLVFVIMVCFFVLE